MTQLYAIIGRQQKIRNDCLHLSDLSDEEIFQTTRFPRTAVEQLYEMLRWCYTNAQCWDLIRF